MLLKRVFVFTLFCVVFSSTAHASVITETLGKTHNFNDSVGLPSSATTDFLPTWDSTYGLQVAEHELLHAIGFSSGYGKFLNALTFNNARTATFFARKDGVVAVVAVFLNDGPFNTGHLDPDGSTKISTPSGSTNLSQSADIMIPILNTTGTAPGLIDRMILDVVFDWSVIGIKITTNPESASQNPFIQKAIENITNLFGGPKENAHPFVWNVRFVVTEPNTMSIFTLGLCLVLLLPIVRTVFRQRSDE